MQNAFFSLPFQRRGIIPEQLLYGCWVAGLSLGFAAVRLMGESFVTLVAQSAGTAGSLAGLLITALCPLLFSAFAVSLFGPRGVFPVCLLRAICLGLMLGGLQAGFGAGAWLAGLLLLFTGLCSSCVQLWYWVRCFRAKTARLRDTVVCGGICTVIALADYLIISPFLVYVINL